MKILFLLIFVFLFSLTPAQELKTENLIIITIDGFRWQEVFSGADPVLLFNEEFTKDSAVMEKFWDLSAVRRREMLFPFFWNVIGTRGQLYGNRYYKNRLNCANPHWFSYPGYSEMLTGLVDKRVDSNEKNNNPNFTVLEFLNERPDYHGAVAAFSSWDVIPYILRVSKSCIPINSGSPAERDEALCASEALINVIQPLFTDPHDNRNDLFTFYYAFGYLKKERPKVLYISFKETDQQGHRGRYDRYLRSVYTTDRMIAELWNWVQKNDQYKDKTTLLITTDHGRGKESSWTKHGRLAFGSGQTWLAVIGPDTPPHGEMKSKSQYFQLQFAKTAAAFLGVDFINVKPVGEKIQSVYYNDVKTSDITKR